MTLKLEEKQETAPELAKEIEKFKIGDVEVARLKIKETIIWDFSKAFDNPPELIHNMRHESLPVWNTYFANHLLLLGIDKNQIKKYYRKGVEIKKNPGHTWGSISDFLKAYSNSHIEQIKKYYQKELVGSFSIIRYGLVKHMLSSEKVLQKGEKSESKMSTALTVETEKKTSAIPIIVVGEEPLTILILKELVEMSIEQCQKIRKNLEETIAFDKKNPDEAKRYIPVMKKFISEWNSYFLGALEIDEQLNILAHNINAASESILKEPNKGPPFSIWRVLVSAFIKCCYSPLKGKLNSILVSSIFKERIAQYEIGMKCDAIIPLGKLGLDDIFKGDPIPTTNVIVDHAELIQKYLCSIVDMHLNEVNVHYVDHTQMASNKTLQAIASEIEKQTVELYMKWEEIKMEKSRYDKLLKKDKKLLNMITIPCFYSHTIKKVAQFILKEKKEAIKELMSTYIQTPTTNWVSPPPALVPTLKLHFKGKIPEGFPMYLYNMHPILCKSYIKQVKILDSVNPRRIEDMEIEIQARTLKVPNLDQSANPFYKMTGLSEKALQQLNMI